MQTPRPSGDPEGACSLPRPFSERVARESDAVEAGTLSAPEHLEHPLKVQRAAVLEPVFRDLCYIMYN